MRSVAVVLPASMCAEIPIFRYLSMGVVRAICPGRFAPNLTGSKRPRPIKTLYRVAPQFYQRCALPTVVCERLVGFSHAMRVFTLAYRGAAILRGLHQFGRKAMRHGFLAARGGGFDDPPHGERLTAVGAYFDGHLIGGAAYPTGLDLDHGFHVIQRLLQHRDGLAAGATALFADGIDCAIDDLLGGGLLTALHHHVDEFGQHIVPELRIGKDGAMGGCCSAGHGNLLFIIRRACYFFGRLAPYLERPCRRSLTPAQSSAPRTVWYRTPGRSLTRPPRISTTECSCKLCPSPPM